MELLRNHTHLRPHHRGCVATIGNFDGVHLGHCAVIEHLLVQAAKLALPATVILFEPQPQEFFLPEQAPPRLTRLREKLAMFQQLGVDRVLCLRFDERLANLSANDFIQSVLVDGLGIKYLIVGDDFRFGKRRQGNFETLRQAGKKHAFQVTDMPTFNLEGDRVSSTRIREALSRGALDIATRLLGRPYSLCGRVAHGDKRGRTLGFPTANIHLHRRFSPLQGVFAVNMHGLDGRPVPGVANLGTRPTVNGPPRLLLEVHLFDFSGEIYGRYIEVEFVAQLREERRFPSFEALKQQIAQDLLAAREIFTNP